MSEDMKIRVDGKCFPVENIEDFDIEEVPLMKNSNEKIGKVVDYESREGSIELTVEFDSVGELDKFKEFLGIGLRLKATIPDIEGDKE